MMMKGEANSTANRAGPGLSLGWAPESAVRWREVGARGRGSFRGSESESGPEFESESRDQSGLKVEV